MTTAAVLFFGGYLVGRAIAAYRDERAFAKLFDVLCDRGIHNTNAPSSSDLNQANP